MEELCEISIGEVRYLLCGAVGVETAMLTAVTFTPMGDISHVSKFGGSTVDTFVDLFSIHVGASHAVA